MSRDYKAIAIGASFGGVKALNHLLPELSKVTDLPILVVLHISPESIAMNYSSINNQCLANVKEAEMNETLKKNCIYFSPADYHLLVDSENNISLSKAPKVNFSRPSISVLFESASDAFDKNLICIILTGYNNDGADGMLHARKNGAITIAQDPASAEIDIMPLSAIQLKAVDYTEDLSNMAALVRSILKASAAGEKLN